ncbi:MAG: hypothetical protein KJZ64_00105 [Sphingomonadaceae bacterium]|nr:hypothetical protein [Sphingomonadaceae bacterium]
MQPNGDSSLADSIAVVTGIVGTVATLVLTLIGLLVAIQFWRGLKRVENIEAQLERDRKNLYGLRFMAESIFSTLSGIISLTDLERRQIIDILEELEKPVRKRRQISSNVFKTFTDSRIDDLSRTSWYFKVMAMDEEDFSPLAGLVEHYPDFQTLGFLRNLEGIFVDALERRVADEANKLEKRLLRG